MADLAAQIALDRIAASDWYRANVPYAAAHPPIWTPSWTVRVPFSSGSAAVAAERDAHRRADNVVAGMQAAAAAEAAAEARGVAVSAAERAVSMIAARRAIAQAEERARRAIAQAEARGVAVSAAERAVSTIATRRADERAAERADEFNKAIRQQEEQIRALQNALDAAKQKRRARPPPPPDAKRDLPLGGPRSLAMQVPPGDDTPDVKDDEWRTKQKPKTTTKPTRTYADVTSGKNKRSAQSDDSTNPFIELLVDRILDGQ